MNVYAHVEERVAAALEALKSEGALPADLAIAKIEAETPRDPTHGDLSPQRRAGAGEAREHEAARHRREAESKARSDPDIAKIDVAGPGFLNLTFKPAFWQWLVAHHPG